MINKMDSSDLYCNQRAVSVSGADITVGIPFHSGIKSVYFQKAVDSILVQTVLPKKILLIQDGSVGQELSALSTYYQASDERVMSLVIPQNMGLAYALNLSILSSHTTYYARMDADDIAVPNRLELQMNFALQNPEIDVIGGFAEDIDVNGSGIRQRRVPTTHQQILRLLWTNPFIHSTVMFRRQAILDVGLYSQNLRKRQDYDLWFRCANSRLQFANIPKTLIHYRFTPETLRRNNWRVSAIHVRIGWRGGWLVRASPYTFILLTIPFFSSLLPLPLRQLVQRFLWMIDPRNKF